MNGIRVRTLFALLVASLAPLLFAGAAAIGIAESALEREAATTHRTHAAAIGAALEAHVAALAARLTDVSADPALQSLDPRRFGAVLEAALFGSGGFRHLVVVDAAGVVRGTRRTLAAVRPEWCEGEALERRTDEVSRALVAAWSDARQSGRARRPAGRGIEGEPLLIVAAAIRAFAEPERVVGCLAGFVSLEAPDLGELLDRLPVPEGGFIALLDGEGAILARTGALPTAAERLESLRPTSGKIGEGLELALNDRRFLLVRSPHAGLPFDIATAIPRETAQAGIAALLGQLAMALLSAVAFALVASAFLSRSLAAPFAALAEGLARLKDGEYGHRIPLEGPDEAIAAARSANALAERLRRSALLGSVWEDLEHGR